jgi:NADH:ubiquinone oxidoreductase subunit 6 (subunit J)
MILIAAIGLLIVVPAVVAMSLRNLIHSALLLIVSWVGVAVFYLWAGAEFVAFAQVLVYVGAISMVVLFAVLLTRRSRGEVLLRGLRPGSALRPIIAAGAVAGVLIGAALSTSLSGRQTPPPTLPTREIGQQLASTHAASLVVVGVLLTVALLGAVVIASALRAEETKRDAGNSGGFST